ncbi:hypothetical protein CEE37_02935 [candidate division LCP-89 bacterium B3_LCP]|uniref:MobA-like NTP transferase domain-containing protein n=1 Tax=candidate division LCP-89 bacterium B3_LCP TaxID=2012998 RepID=A0A532V2U1_UNCL8|nr:MAG: hypothetical protein CEE37_02935 [candidate division LCP-89 bacterium B3_LCP]
MIASIILSAGDSRRMGQPKALLPYNGNCFLDKIISDYSSLSCQPIIVVLGKDVDLIESGLQDQLHKVMINSRPELGPLSSLKVGLSGLLPENEGCFFHPVDHPVVKVETLKNVITAWNTNPAKAVRPRYNRRGGHPVLIGSEWIQPILDLPPQANMRDLMHSRSEDVIELEVSDPGVILNIDTPEQYHELLANAT